MTVLTAQETVQNSGWATANVGAAPFAPVITSPAYGSSVDFTAGVVIDWDFLSPLGLSQGSYAIGFMELSSGTYLWWNGSALVSSPVYNSSSSETFTLPADTLLNGNSYSVVVGTADSNGVTGPNSAPLLLIGAPVPVVNITAPTGTLTVGTQTLVWQNLNVQTVASYQVIVYTAAQVAAGGFVAGEAPFIWDSGLTQGSANSQVLPNLPNGSFVAYVQITSSTGAQSVWTPWDLTYSYTAPQTPTLTVSYDQTTQTTSVTVVGHDTGGLVGSTTTTVYRSSDGGSTWTAVSNITSVAVPSVGQTVTATDYTPQASQPEGTTSSIEYYAVISGPSGITSSRSTTESATAGWAAGSTGWNFLDSTTYATHLQPWVKEFNQVQTIRGGLHSVLGNPEPVFLQDVTSGRTFKLTLLTLAETDWVALKALLETGHTLYVTNIYGLVAFCQLAPDGYSEDQAPGSVASTMRTITCTLVETAVLPTEGAGT
jgi:hypothetical protein